MTLERVKDTDGLVIDDTLDRLGKDSCYGYDMYLIRVLA